MTPYPVAPSRSVASPGPCRRNTRCVATSAANAALGTLPAVQLHPSQWGLRLLQWSPAALLVVDPLRARYRQALNELMRYIVFYGRTLEGAFSEVPVDAADLATLSVIVNTELDHLKQYNCARYNLARGMTQRWIDAGRLRQSHIFTRLHRTTIRIHPHQLPHLGCNWLIFVANQPVAQ